jgi:hypothetical protein
MNIRQSHLQQSISLRPRLSYGHSTDWHFSNLITFLFPTHPLSADPQKIPILFLLHSSCRYHFHSSEFSSFYPFHPGSISILGRRHCAYFAFNIILVSSVSQYLIIIVAIRMNRKIYQISILPPIHPMIAVSLSCHLIPHPTEHAQQIPDS